MPSQKIYKNFLFNKKRDKRILAWLNAQENQSEIVRNALAAFMVQQGVIAPEVSLEDVMAEIRLLADRVANIKVVSTDDQIQKDEPQDIVNKLKGFGL